MKTASSTPTQRSAAVDDLIALVGAVDGILQAQAQADAGYFMQAAGTAFTDTQRQQIHDKVLKAYRWQYIVSGVMEPRFQKVLFGLIDEPDGDPGEERARAADLRHSGPAGNAVAARGLTAGRPRPSHAFLPIPFTGEHHVLRHAFRGRPQPRSPPRGASPPACARVARDVARARQAPGATPRRAANSSAWTTTPCATWASAAASSTPTGPKAIGLAEQSRRRVMQDFHGSPL